MIFSIDSSKVISKFLALLLLILCIFIVFAFCSKPAVKKNIAEKDLYAEQVFSTYKLMGYDVTEKHEFVNELSILKKRINYTQKTEFLNGIFVYRYKKTNILKLYWHKKSDSDIEIEKIVIEDSVK